MKDRDPRLSDALYQYALAAGAAPPREVLNEFVRKYPEFHDEIVEFAVDLALEYEGDDDDSTSRKV